MKDLKRLLFVLLFLFSASEVYGQRLQTYFKQDSINTGGVFTLSLVLNQDTSYSDIQYPDSTSFGNDLFIRNRQQFRINDLTDSLVYELQFFGNEDLRVPALPVRLIKEADTRTLFTDPIFIPHKTLLPNEEAAIRPPKPIFDFPDAWWPYVIAFLLGAGIAYAIYRYWLKNREETVEKPTYTPPPFINPLDRLEDELLALKTDGTLVEQKDFKLFYIRLGDAIRRYYEDLYKIPALESTSRELLRFMDVFGVEPSMKQHTRKILNEADMVKFAKFTPSLEQAWKTHSIGVEFMEIAKDLDTARINSLKERHEEMFAPKNQEEEQEEVA